jgi:hypothetical protein
MRDEPYRRSTSFHACFAGDEILNGLTKLIHIGGVTLALGVKAAYCILSWRSLGGVGRRGNHVVGRA